MAASQRLEVTIDEALTWSVQPFGWGQRFILLQVRDVLHTFSRRGDQNRCTAILSLSLALPAIKNSFTNARVYGPAW